MKGQPFFIKLYNLHLSGKIPPTEQEKQKFIETVSVHHKLSFLIFKYSSGENFTFEIKKQKTIDEEKELLGTGLPKRRRCIKHNRSMDRQKHPPILSKSDLPVQYTQTSEQRQLTLFPLPEKEIKKSQKRLNRKSTTNKKDEVCVQLTLLPV